MKTINDIPVFLVNVDTPECSITTMSLVDFPAMEMEMVCFEKQEEKKMTFAIQDEMKHNIMTVMVRTNFPILRMDEAGNPYYIVFDRKTSETLCARLMKDGYQQNISLDHNGELIDGVTLQEVFIKDTTKGINPVGFEDADEGSLFGIYHIENDDLWKDCLEGRFGGISIESYLRLEQFKKIDNTKKPNNMMSKIKEMLKSILMEFNNLSTDKAELYWEEDSDLGVGMSVYIYKDGERVAPEDGEYISDQNKIKIEDGKVTEIEKKEGEGEGEKSEPKEDPAEPKEGEIKKEGEVNAEGEGDGEKKEEPEPESKEGEGEKDDKIAALEAKVAELEAKIAELVEKITEIATTPAAEPVVDQFEKIMKSSKTGDKNFDKLKSAWDEIRGI